MGQRSRKRAPGRAGAGGTASGPAAAREGAAEARTPGEPGAGPAAPRRPSRTELRNAEARASLRPLAPGEKPGAIKVATVVSVALAILVVVGYVSGARVGGEGTLGGALFLSAIFLVAAYGMWGLRYWAVLGFEVLLGFQITVAGLSLLVASNWWAALLCTAVMLLGGTLFWKLIRSMARIQMPARRPPAG